MAKFAGFVLLYAVAALLLIQFVAANGGNRVRDGTNSGNATTPDGLNASELSEQESNIEDAASNASDAEDDARKASRKAVSHNLTPTATNVCSRFPKVVLETSAEGNIVYGVREQRKAWWTRHNTVAEKGDAELELIENALTDLKSKQKVGQIDMDTEAKQVIFQFIDETGNPMEATLTVNKQRRIRHSGYVLTIGEDRQFYVIKKRNEVIVSPTQKNAKEVLYITRADRSGSTWSAVPRDPANLQIPCVLSVLLTAIASSLQ